MTLRTAALAAILPLSCLAQDPVFIDDTKLSASFEASLARLAEEGVSLTLKKARRQIDAAIDKKALLSPKRKPTDESDSVYDKSSPAIVAIGTVYQCGKCDKWHQDGFSTGWIASPDGLIVTNAHVFEGETDDSLGVMTRDGRVYPVKEIVAADRNSDIAVLRIETNGIKLPALTLAGSATPGEEVHVISHPQGRLYCQTSGRISRFHRQHFKEHNRPTDWMSITADFAGGSSGGPVLNNRGEVVGMVASTLTAYSENTGCKNLPDPEVQMVFKDCVPLTALRSMFDSAE